MGVKTGSLARNPTTDPHTGLFHIPMGRASHGAGVIAHDVRSFHPGQVGAATGLGLNLSFVFMTLADAFTVEGRG